MANANNSNAASPDKGLMNKNVTAPSPPPDDAQNKAPREEPPPGLEERNLTRPADMDVERKP